MKCSECGHENRADAKFCEECGARLAPVCTSCVTYAYTIMGRGHYRAHEEGPQDQPQVGHASFAEHSGVASK